MKKIFILCLLISTFAMAAEPVVPPSPLEEDVGSSKPVKPKKAERPHPCAMIERVCKEAQFKEWISRDCVIPILKGKKVDGVKTDDISNQQIKACQMEKKLIHY